MNEPGKGERRRKKAAPAHAAPEFGTPAPPVEGNRFPPLLAAALLLAFVLLVLILCRTTGPGWLPAAGR